jgi:hypothetical protein
LLKDLTPVDQDRIRNIVWHCNTFCQTTSARNSSGVNPARQYQPDDRAGENFAKQYVRMRMTILEIKNPRISTRVSF